MRTRGRFISARGRRFSGFSGGGAFTPFSVPNVMRYWWDFSDPTTVFQDAARTTPATGTNPLGGVSDKSSNGRHLSQSTAGTRPVLDPTGIGNRQALNIASGTKWLSTGAFGADLPQPSTLFIVVKNFDNTVLRIALDGEATGGRNAVVLNGPNSSSKYSWSMYGGSGYNGELLSADPGVYILCYEFNGDTSKLWRNGVRTRGANTDPFINNVGTAGCGGVTIGSDSGKTNFPFKGWIGEAFAYSGTLTDANRNGVLNYLALKWSRSVYTKDVYGGTAFADGWVLLVPPLYRTGDPAPLVYYHHGRLGASNSVYTDSLTFSTVQALQTAGYWIAASDGGSTTHWGNPQSVAVNKALRTFLENRGDTFSRVMLWPISMGGASAWNCLRDSQFAGIKGMYLTYPVCSLAAIHAANFGGTFAAELDAAYASVGGYGPYDPLTLSAAGYPDARYKFVASLTDLTVPELTHTDPMRVLLASRSPALRNATLLRSHTGDHGDPTAFDGADTVAFFDTCV